MLTVVFDLKYTRIKRINESISYTFYKLGANTQGNSKEIIYGHFNKKHGQGWKKNINSQLK